MEMVKLGVAKNELPRLAGNLDFLKGVIEIDRKIYGKESYDRISKTVENAVWECQDIADRLLTFGIQEEQ
jgi:hypothetical protein